ncbi:MAG TPA: DNA starvation/stationary phase protection protein [Nitrososphaeraceae archaeon]|jgi:starvation-inducible DNA-binding protein
MNKLKSKTVILDIDTGISRESLQKIANILNDDLADEYVLLTKTRNYHWNVEDPRFNDLHKFFDEHYELLSVAVDEIAERVRAVGGRTRAALKEFINSSQIREDVGSYPNADTMLGNLLSDHETIIKTLRKNINECQELNDEGTANFLTDKMEEHEKMAWMLRSFIA